MLGMYQIRVRGHLDPEWSEWFTGLSIENQPNGEALLTGPLPDQATLFGILTRIRDLGLPLVKVTQTELEDKAEDAGMKAV